MKDEQLVTIEINKIPSFSEIWFEGVVEYGEKRHKFWLIRPQGLDSNDEEYEIEIRWFFQKVPREVRGMIPQIIEAFKQTLK